MPVVSLQDARSAIWKAVADNKVTHAANLLASYPSLSDGGVPLEVQNGVGSPDLGWYGRAIAQIPLLKRPEETQKIYAKGLETLDFLKQAQFPFKGTSEFGDHLVLKKILRTPGCPYGEWFVVNGFLTHSELIQVVTGEKPSPTRKSFSP